MKPRKFIKREQVDLWDDLYESIRQAANGQWSIKCDFIAHRIIDAARIVGPSPHGKLPYYLIAGGVYEAILRKGGITPDLPSSEREWTRLDALMQPHGQTREICRPKCAGTMHFIERDLRV